MRNDTLIILMVSPSQPHQSTHLIGLQAEEELREVNEGYHSCQQENKLRIFSNSLPEFHDTLIPAYILEKYPHEWQAHVERISDFLYPESEGPWWQYGGENVLFHDSGIHPNTRPDGPLLHHFRSSSVRKEEVYLEGCWSKCLDEGIRLPCHYLLIPDPGRGKRMVPWRLEVKIPWSKADRKAKGEPIISIYIL